jgi:hypothetical protein
MRRLLAAGLLLSFACGEGIVEPPPEQRLVVSRPGDAVTFAVIGDYGQAGKRERAVAELVQSWDPELVITLGDNNYPDGEAETIDENVGQYYHRFIAPYRGHYGSGAEVNRFFPVPGNHDWKTRNLAPYLDYFELPGNERYYAFNWGPVRFFAVDSDPHEPDGNGVDSEQAHWLEGELARAEAPWKVVYMHHPPHSSGPHHPERSARWPYHAWGADVVMAGHDHIYERIERPEGLYLVNGLGGHRHRYPIGEAEPGSVVRFNATQGAMRVEATTTRMSFSFVTARGEIVDTRTLTRSPPGAEIPGAAARSEARP